MRDHVHEFTMGVWDDRPNVRVESITKAKRRVLRGHPWDENCMEQVIVLLSPVRDAKTIPPAPSKPCTFLLPGVWQHPRHGTGRRHSFEKRGTFLDIGASFILWFKMGKFEAP